MKSTEIIIKENIPTLNKIISVLDSDIEIQDMLFSTEWFAKKYNLDFEQVIIAFMFRYKAKYINQYFIVECTECNTYTNTKFEYSMKNLLEAMSNFKCNHCGNTNVLKTKDNIFYKFNQNTKERNYDIRE